MLSLKAPLLAYGELQEFDEDFVLNEASLCAKNKIPQSTYSEWLLSEVKKVAETDVATIKHVEQIWDRGSILFKINGEEVDSRLESVSPGTFGIVNDHKVNFSNVGDGETLSASLVDVGRGTLKDLNGRLDLENKIWLVERSDLIPSLVAMSMEVKFHKGLGLVVYGKNKVSLDPPGAFSVLPIIEISEALSHDLKKKIKESDVTAAIKIRADFPKVRTQNWITVKKGEGSLRVAVTADDQDCSAVADLLGVINWAKHSPEQKVNGTIFGFAADDHELTEQATSSLRIDNRTFKLDQFVKEWIRRDKNPIQHSDGAILKRASSDVINFAGVVDKELLSEYKTDLKSLDSLAKIRPELAVQFKAIYQPENLSDLALDLKTLRLVHQFAQRGQWEKAVKEFQRISDYGWAANVTPSTFVEYSKSLKQPELRVDPALWEQLQRGREHIDGFIEAVETEIDRVDKIVSDNFFKIYKTIENLKKI